MIRYSSKQGFTVVELLIVLGVFSMLTGVVLARYRTFDTNARFVNASEDVILALRQAQVYGVGAKGHTVTCGGATAFDCAYGVYFSTAAANKNGITFFVDANNNKIYDAGEELPSEKISWASNIAVTGLTCDGVACTTGVLSVTFRRPSPDAFVNDTFVSPVTSPYTKAVVTLTDSNTLKTSNVTVTRFGQISFQ